MESSLSLFAAFAVQLFVVVDPVPSVPIFLAITPGNSALQRRAMAARGCLTAFLIILFFLFFGRLVLAYFGIGTPAVRICSGLLLFVIALEMLYGRISGTGTSPQEKRLAEEKEDVSITPLAVPLLAGPGAIATTLIFADQVVATIAWLVLAAASALVFLVTFLLFSQADRVERLVGRLGITIITRVMGLILAFLAVQYTVDGLVAVIRAGS